MLAGLADTCGRICSVPERAVVLGGTVTHAAKLILRLLAPCTARDANRVGIPSIVRQGLSPSSQVFDNF